MPRVKLGYYNIPEWQRNKAEELRQRYGRGAISRAEFGMEAGLTDAVTIAQWIEGVPYYQKPGSAKRHYPVEDVAKRLYEFRHE